MRTKVIELIKEIAEKEEIDISDLDYKAKLTENGFDSILIIELILLLEDEFKIKIPDEFLLMSKVDTIEKIVYIIEGQVSE